MQDEITDFLFEWLGRRGNVPGSTLEERLALNYFDARLIDSLGVIEFVADIEARFDIRFDERHFQDRRFSTVGGLRDIVLDLIGRAA